VLVIVLFVTTPLDIQQGWLCCKDFDKTMKRTLVTELSWVYSAITRILSFNQVSKPGKRF